MHVCTDVWCILSMQMQLHSFTCVHVYAYTYTCTCPRSKSRRMQNMVELCIPEGTEPRRTCDHDQKPVWGPETQCRSHSIGREVIF